MTTIPGITSQTPLPQAKADLSSTSVAEKSFSDYLNSTIDQVADAQKTGNSAIENLNTGQAQNMHQVMLAVTEADISMRMLVQLRNKALEAYNAVMAMQI